MLRTISRCTPVLILTGVTLGQTVVEPGWYLAETYFLQGAYSARYNPADGRIYAASRTTGATAGIYVFDSAGVATHLVTVDNPGGMDIAANGDLFYCLDFPGTIQRLPFGSTTPETWVTDFHSGDDDPIGLSIAPANANFTWLAPGDALVSDRGSGGPDEIWKWSTTAPEGETVVHADGGSILVNPWEVAVGASRVWIVDDVNAPNNGKIYSMASDGTLTLLPGPGVDRPASIQVDPATQDLIVNDAGLERIVRINERSGTVSNMFTGFIDPAANCLDVFDHGDAILVSDFGTNRIYVFRRERTTCVGAPIDLLPHPIPTLETYGRIVAVDGTTLLIHNGASSGSLYHFVDLQADGSWAAVGSGCVGCNVPNPVTAAALDGDFFALAGSTSLSGQGRFFASAGVLSSGGYTLVNGSALGVTGLGSDIRIVGHELFVGAASHANGHVFVYDYLEGPTDWVLQYEIALPTFPTQTGGMSPNFGFSIDCDGDTLIIGAPGVDITGVGQDVGAAYIYTRDPGTGEWTLALITEGNAAGDQHGFDVAIRGQTAAVGAPYANSSMGQVRRLRCDAGTWQQSGLMSNANAGAQFGWKVALSPDTLVVGAPGTSNTFSNAGVIFVYARSGPESWTLVPSASLYGDQLNERVGESFDISDENLVVVGLPYTDVGGEVDAGLVWPIYLGNCPDCNGDALPDPLQILAGLPDTDGDAIPDECEPIVNATALTFHPTIQRAVGEAVYEGAPDTIELPPGTTTESVFINRSVRIASADPEDRSTLAPGELAFCLNPYTSGPPTPNEVTVENIDFVPGIDIPEYPEIALGSYKADLTVANCTFSGFDQGSACEIGSDDGFSIVTFTGCDFLRNDATSAGGPSEACVKAYSSVIIDRCRFIGNAGPVGAVSFNPFGPDQSMMISNSLFLGNHSVTQGGAIAAWLYDGAGLHIANCTFLHNSANAPNSGVVALTGDEVNATVSNSIFWQNTTLEAVGDGTTAALLSYNLVTPSVSGGGNITGDPEFIADPTPGTDTEWGTSDDTGNMTPWRGSPAIDGAEWGLYSFVTGVNPDESLDLEGNPRAIEHPGYNGPGFPGFPGLDIGAYEAPASTPTACPGDVNGDGFTQSADFVILAGNYGNAVVPGTGGDLSGDAFVNSADFVILAGDFGCPN